VHPGRNGGVARPRVCRRTADVAARPRRRVVHRRRHRRRLDWTGTAAAAAARRAVAATVWIQPAGAAAAIVHRSLYTHDTRTSHYRHHHQQQQHIKRAFSIEFTIRILSIRGLNSCNDFNTSIHSDIVCTSACIENNCATACTQCSNYIAYIKGDRQTMSYVLLNEDRLVGWLGFNGAFNTI